MKKIAFVLGILFTVAGCGGSNSSQQRPVETPAQQQPGKYLFAVVYENHAWAKTKKGFVVKGNGDLYQFDVSDAAVEFPTLDPFGETELTRYFEAARFEFVESLNPELLNNLWLEGKQINNGTLGKEQNNCRDAGTYRYLMFQPTANQKYQQTLIYQTGDFRREQLDNKADKIKDYLVKQAVKLNIAYILDPDSNNWCSGL